MELKLYQQLNKSLLGDLAQAAARFDPAYQQAVERYAPQTESGIRGWGKDAIALWLKEYAKLMPKPVRLRYYQILALYFTEGVLREKRAGTADFVGRNMLAYWMATGSGKTLLMHLNILQYIAHLGSGDFHAGLRAFNELHIILTTPGVNLIDQHRREITPLVERLNRLCADRIRLTVESTGSLLNSERSFFKLTPSSKIFRLVLVDEGHIGLASGGATAGAFKKLRHDLADFPNAFLFEYSATYHGIAEQYVSEYEEQIVYDYNYYRFYKDGYGKDYSIQTIGADVVAESAELWENFGEAFNTLAGKLAVHHELRTKPAAGLPFEAQFTDKPLIAFMGNTVEDSKKEGNGSGDEVSDIRKLLAYLAKLTAKERKRLAPVFNGETAGVLTLTRCPAVADEIWLSWGDGAYWGIVNVGNGDKFFNDSENHPELKDAHGNALVHLRKRPIVDRSFHFAEIDSPASPINVLIGSRKFAEGWNCYRVSVIGLINLGSGKGNKIIQIFGRGVRLKGLQADGKRKHREHADEYATLVRGDTSANRLRRLETLNVFSLRATYLTRFLEALKDEIPQWTVERSIAVTTRPVQLGKGKKPVAFSDYKKELSVFKVGRDEHEPRLVVTRVPSGQWRWQYSEGATMQSGDLAWNDIRLDYRRDAESASHDLGVSLREWVCDAEDRPNPFAPHARLAETLAQALQVRKMQMLWDTGSEVRHLVPIDLLRVIAAVEYHHPFPETTLAVRETLAIKSVADAIAQLHHKLIYDINKRKYRYGEPLAQSTPGKPGDFISGYSVKLGFETEDEKLEFETTYPSPKLPDQLTLKLEEPANPYQPHIYKPLYRDGMDTAVKALKYKEVAISPDALNPGERKFVDDLHQFLSEPSRQGWAGKFSFYLMRNVESLRSVGVYLDSEARAYFPDFVLWVVTPKQTSVLLIDPKGQSGIQDLASMAGGANAKVKLAKSGHLAELARKLESAHKPAKKFVVHSFILLRDSSELGRISGAIPTTAEIDVIADMEKHHVLRLDWAATNENGDARTAPDDRDYLERMFKLSQLL